MAKPQLTILIDGPAGSGKSTLAQHFATYLKIVHRRDVTLYDDGGQQILPAAHNPVLPRLNAEITITVEPK